MDKKTILLKTGEKLFSQYGYRNVNIEEIASHAGLATGSFYTYFNSKEEFYSQVLDRIEEEGINHIDRLISSFHSPINKLKAVYRFATLGLRKNIILKGILTGDKKFVYPGLNERKENGSKLINHISLLLERIIREGTEKRVFRAGIFKNPRRMLFTIYNAIISEFDNGDVEELMDDTLLLIERGMRRMIRLRKRDERLDRRKNKTGL